MSAVFCVTKRHLGTVVHDVSGVNDVKSTRVGLNNRMNELIRKIYEKNGKPVVVFVLFF